jgi:Family of unknown function (DUF5995)
MTLPALRPLAVLAGVVALAVTGAALVDRTPDSVAAEAGFGAGPVHASTPRTGGWAAVAGLGPRLSPTSANACERGDTDCLAVVLREMKARLVAQGCAHTAPFAFTYMEMTRGVYGALLDPGFFADPPASAYADARFARLYFDAFDNWAAGRVHDVPGAWRIAFGAAESGETNAATDMLLGISAHIGRDLPYVVADVAAWQRDPGARPSDFDRINDVIAIVKGPMLRRAADRFDPTLALLDLPLPALAATDSAELIGTWRNQALERGIRLSRATTDAEREAVEGEIEREAMATAVLLLNAGTTRPSPVSPTERDAYCESQRS